MRINLQITFDRPNLNGIYEDLSDYLSFGYIPGDIKGLLKITYPDTIEQDFSLLSSPPLEAPDFKFENPLRTDVDGEIMEGTYTFTYEVYDSGVLIETLVRTLEFSYTPVTVSVTENIDTLTPNFSLTDVTDYGKDGYDETVTRDFSFEAPGITTATTSGSGSTLSLGIGGVFYETIYNYSLTSDIVYEGTDNDWFTLLDTVSTSSSVTPTKPLMIPEIIALVNCMYTKLSGMECCDNANYLSLKADYEHVTSLFYNFVTNGQAGITSGQSTLLTDMLTIFKKWGCADDGTISDVAISSYDWCLCDGDGSGGSKNYYAAGDGAMASSTVDNAVTFAKAAGVGTFTISSGYLAGATIQGSGADAAYDSNGATQSFKIVIPTTDANTAYAAAIVANLQVWEAANSGSISDATPLVMDEGSVQKRIVDISSNSISIVLAGIGATYSSGWLVTLVMP